MIRCDYHQDDESQPALVEVARVLAQRMIPPENAKLPPRLAELVAALLARDCEHGNHL